MLETWVRRASSQGSKVQPVIQLKRGWIRLSKKLCVSGVREYLYWVVGYKCTKLIRLIPPLRHHHACLMRPSLEWRKKLKLAIDFLVGHIDIGIGYSAQFCFENTLKEILEGQLILFKKVVSTRKIELNFQRTI